jgi:hypothetical protein
MTDRLALFKNGQGAVSAGSSPVVLSGGSEGNRGQTNRPHCPSYFQMNSSFHKLTCPYLCLIIPQKRALSVVIFVRQDRQK